jgi:subtilisin family serine protease
MTVGAVSRDGYHARFSSYGFANRSYIKPNLMARGVLSVVAAVKSYDSGYSNGTSFSAPIMAGMTASFWQAFPTLNNQEIIRALEYHADNYQAADTAYGYGIPDFYASFKALNPATTEIVAARNFYYVHTSAVHLPRLVFNNKADLPQRWSLETAEGKKLWTRTPSVALLETTKPWIQKIPNWLDLPAGVYFLNIRKDGKDKKICLLK